MTPAVQKFLALALLVLAVIGVTVLIPVPYVSFVKAKQGEIAALEGTLARYTEILARAETIQKQASGNQGSLDAYFLEGRATSLGAAEVQGLFNNLTRQTGIAGGSFRPLPERREGAVKKVGFRVTFQASAYNYFQLLEAISLSRPLMVTENIQVKAPRDQQPGVDPVLNIQMDVYGLQEVEDVT